MFAPTVVIWCLELSKISLKISVWYCIETSIVLHKHECLNTGLAILLFLYGLSGNPIKDILHKKVNIIATKLYRIYRIICF